MAIEYGRRICLAVQRDPKFVTDRIIERANSARWIKDITGLDLGADRLDEAPKQHRLAGSNLASHHRKSFALLYQATKLSECFTMRLRGVKKTRVRAPTEGLPPAVIICFVDGHRFKTPCFRRSKLRLQSPTSRPTI